MYNINRVPSVTSLLSCLFRDLYLHILLFQVRILVVIKVLVFLTIEMNAHHTWILVRSLHLLQGVELTSTVFAMHSLTV